MLGSLKKTRPASTVPPERGSGGAFILRSLQTLQPYPRCMGERLVHWAERTPDHVFLAKRGRDGAWRTLKYGEALDRARRIAQSLLDRELSAERPLAILSGNDLDHALLALAAQHAGVPYAPISPAYSLVSSDHARLKHLMRVLNPGLVFVADPRPYERAIRAAVPAGAEIVCREAPLPSRPCTSFEDLEAAEDCPDVDSAFAAVGPDTVAKILFTSGSTGLPKGVINTQRMLCSNQQSLAQMLPPMSDEPPVLVDWLPWHHTFGGNHNFGIALYHGGSLYIDEGKPVLGGIEETVRNLREIATTVYFNVPKGFEILIPYFRAEPAFRDHFFSRLKALFYAAAGMSQYIWRCLIELSQESCGAPIPIITGLGATETAPAAVLTDGRAERAGIIGLPMPGTEVKLVPVGPKLEIRVKGPNVTPGYWRDLEKTRAAFDEEGYYRMGDAVKFIDPDDPAKGLEFDGRINEDFKLSTGTWVNVGLLRTQLIQRGAPLVRDAVIAAPDRDFLSALIFPDVDACRAFCLELPRDASPGAVLASAAVRGKFQSVLDALAAASTGSANRIDRALLLEEPPSIDAGEATDKGTINQRAVLDRRSALVEECYEAGLSPRLIVALAPQPQKG
jgi:feruloyl-CoA synthase